MKPAVKKFAVKFVPRHVRALAGVAVVLAFCGFVAAGCGASVPSDAFCTVYGTALPIKGGDQSLSFLMDSAKKGYKQQGQKFPKKGSSDYKKLQEQAINYLIEQQLFQREANKLGVKVSNKEVTSHLNQLIQQTFGGDKSKYKAELKTAKITDKQVRDNLRSQLLQSKLNDKVTKDVKVNATDAHKYYNDNLQTYTKPESRTVAHILVKSKAQAEKIYQQVKNGNQKTFAKLAKKYSIDTQTKDKGGVFPVTKGNTVPAFDKVAFSLKTGQTSPPVHSQYGWHIIQARSAITPAKVQSFASVQKEIISSLKSEQQQREFTDFQTNLLKKAQGHVECQKAYVWTQTVTTNSSVPSVPVTPSSTGSTATSTTKATTSTATTKTSS